MVTKKEVIQKVEEKLGTLSTDILNVINFAYEAGCIEEAIKHESKAKEENKTSPCVECVFCDLPLDSHPCGACCYSYSDMSVRS